MINTMKTIKLMAGQYSPEEASEMLLEMISRKINFHKLKNLSSEVRFGTPNPEAHKRIAELQQAKDQILALKQQVTDLNMHLSIQSSIQFTFTEAEPRQEKAQENSRCFRVGSC